MSVNSISSSFAFSSAGMTIDAEYQRMAQAKNPYGRCELLNKPSES